MQKTAWIKADRQKNELGSLMGADSNAGLFEGNCEKTEDKLK